MFSVLKLKRDDSYEDLDGGNNYEMDITDPAMREIARSAGDQNDNADQNDSSAVRIREGRGNKDNEPDEGEHFQYTNFLMSQH